MIPMDDTMTEEETTKSRQWQPQPPQPQQAPNVSVTTTKKTRRGVLQAAGRPLLRVSRALLPSNSGSGGKPPNGSGSGSGGLQQQQQQQQQSGKKYKKRRSRSRRRHRRRRNDYGALIHHHHHQQQQHNGMNDSIIHRSLRATSPLEEQLDLDDDGKDGSIIARVPPLDEIDNDDDDHDHDDERIVLQLERLLRQALLLLGAYLLGNYQPHRHWIPLALGYLAAAWMTCVLILLLLAWRQHQKLETKIDDDEDEDEEHLRLLDPSYYTEEDHEEEVEEEEVDDMETGSRGLVDALLPTTGRKEEEEDVEEYKEDVDAVKTEDTSAIRLLHPSLRQFYVLNTASFERFLPNTGQAYRLDNEWFEGVMMILLRTPDVDKTDVPCRSSSNYTQSHNNNKAADYFRGKQRRFEFQYQLKLRKVPTGRIYFAAELKEPVKLGMIQRAFVGAAMAFVKKMNPSCDFALSGSPPNARGTYELPHFAFTVEGGMDRVVATPPGQPLPELGSVIVEDDESIKRRKKGGRIEWNTRDTYTFAVWSAYVDLLEWKCLNLPGIRPFSLTSVVGDQHINLTLYSIPQHAEKHTRCDMVRMVDLEMSNRNHCALGPFAKRYVDLMPKVRDNDVEEDEEEEEKIGTLLETGESTSDLGFELVEREDEDEEAATVDALGESIYLRSGDSIILQEAHPGSFEDDISTWLVGNGGGFAVLRNQTAYKIIIEKTSSRTMEGRHASDSVRARSKLIKSGDKVMIKLVSEQTNVNQIEVKYLSIHRGWWLKWVSTPPTKNGFFRIYTHETEFSPEYRTSLSESQETQSSYLTLGGTFWLRHQRWSKYYVGVSSHESATYGGRMLGLYRPDGSGLGGEMRLSDCEDEDEEVGIGVHRDREWMKPLQLRAQLATVSVGRDRPEAPFDAKELSGTSPLPESLLGGKFTIDVPVWVEMMNRTERRRQLLYVVRVLSECPQDRAKASGGHSDEFEVDEETRVTCCFSRLRTGDDLAALIRLSRSSSLRDVISGLARKPSTSSDFNINPRSSSHDDLITATTGEAIVATDDLTNMYRSRSENHLEQTSESHDIVARDENREEGAEETSTPAESLAPALPSFSSPRHGNKGRKLIGQLAKSVKTGTSVTGKQVVKQSRKVGKGTVTAGKVIITPISRTNVRSNKPPGREPTHLKVKTPGRKTRRRTARDHYVVINKAMRSMERKTSLQLMKSPKLLAGQLSASDQSCRKASHMLSHLDADNVSSDSSTMMKLSSNIAPLFEFDTCFLQGGAIQLGVVPEPNQETVVFECLVARCLWESHWREEWCAVYESGVSWYPPLTKKPALYLSFIDIDCVRPMEMDELSPLPGFSLLALETAWQCHYVAFVSDDARDVFVERLKEAMIESNSEEHWKEEQGHLSLRDDELRKAHFWQGFQSSIESSLSDGQGKWAKISSSSKMKHRLVLNSRRMVFDTEPLPLIDDTEDENSRVKNLCSFVEKLLATSLSFSLSSLERKPKGFVDFLDAASQLKHLMLDEIDLASDEAVCIFVNLYHCLLQHALLVTVGGPLNKRSAGHFMRTACYEIGGDVFSLAELHSCVIRGKLPRAVVPKNPYVEAPRKSASYRFYALQSVDARINFVLNTGDKACPQSVPVLQAHRLDQQLDAAASVFIQSQMRVVPKHRLIILPKVCEVYRNDFGGGEDESIIAYLLRFLDREAVKDLRSLLSRDESMTSIVVRYQPTSQQYHMVLKLLEDDS